MPLDDATTDDQPQSGATNEELLAFMRDLPANERPVAEARGTLGSWVKRNKTAGVPIEPAKFIHKLAKKGRSEAVEFLRQAIRCAHLVQLIEPTQLDILGNVDIRVSNQAREQFSLAQAQEFGYRDGRGGVSADDNPRGYPLASEIYVEWCKWLKKGAAAQAREHPEAKQATASKANPRDEVEDAPKKAAAKKANGTRLAIAGPAGPAKRKAGRPAGAKDRKPRKMAAKKANGAQHHAS